MFLDNKRLKNGRRFDDDFCRSLLSSLMVVPLISAGALERMARHDPAAPDYVLLEWVLALEAFSAPSSRVERIFPVLFGEPDPVRGGFGNLFEGDALDRLPEVVPTETLAQAGAQLERNRVAPIPGFAGRTVKGIVGELMKFLSFTAWTASSPHNLVTEAIFAAENILIQCRVDCVPGGIIEQPPPLNPEAVATAAPVVSTATTAERTPVAAGAAAATAPSQHSEEAADIYSWDIEAVASWLNSLKLPEVAQNAKEAEIDGLALKHIDKFDWKELGATGIQSTRICGKLDAMKEAYAKTKEETM